MHDPRLDPGQWNRVTGTSDGWVEVAVDLSGFAGAPVQVAISYVTDRWSPAGPGCSWTDARGHRRDR